MLWIIFFLWTVLEITFIVLGVQLLGVFGVALIIILSALAGFALIRRSSLNLQEQFEDLMRQGKISPTFVEQCALVTPYIAGVLLILPGLFGDLLALVILLPISRRLVQAIIHRLGQTQTEHFYFYHGRYQRYSAGRTFEGDVVDVEPVSDAQAEQSWQDRIQHFEKHD